MYTSAILAILPLLTSALTIVPRALNIPAATGDVTLDGPQRVTGTFDCEGRRYGLGMSCAEGDGGEEGAVFILEQGATLKNCIIGADQREGVHCAGSCTIQNVFWEKVCEDAVTILQESGVSRIIGGGAQGAEDKVVQHNGLGTVEVRT